MNHHGGFLSYKKELGLALRSLSEYILIVNASDPRVFNLLDESEQILSLVLEHDPHDHTSFIALVRSYVAHADSLGRNNQKELALNKIELAIRLLDQALIADSENSLAKENRHFAAETKAELLVDFGRYDLALDEWKIAIRLAPAAFVDIARLKSARTQIVAGDLLGGIQVVDEVLAESKPSRTENMHLLRESSRCFALAAKSAFANEEDPDHNELGEHYALRAVRILEKLLELSSENLNFIQTCPDLDCLRQRANFKAILSLGSTKAH